MMALSGVLQLVAHVGEKLAFRPICHFGRLFGLSQFGLARLERGNVRARADRAAVAGAHFVDENPAPAGKLLLDRLMGLAMGCEPLGQPLLLATDGRRILAVLEPVSKNILEARSRHVGGARERIELMNLFVAQDETVLRIEQHEAVRNRFDRFEEPQLRGFGAALAFVDACLVRHAAAIAAEDSGLVQERAGTHPPVSN